MEIKFDNGKVYYSHQLLSYGHYDNSCAVERANVRYLIEHDDLKDSIFETGGCALECSNLIVDAKLIKAIGTFGGVKVWIRSDIEEEYKFIEYLYSYPCLDDELVNVIESELEEEAWSDWIKRDLFDELNKISEEVANYFFDLDNDISFGMFKQSQEWTNETYCIESGGIYYIKVEKLIPAIITLIQEYKDELAGQLKLPFEERN